MRKANLYSEVESKEYGFVKKISKVIREITQRP